MERGKRKDEKMSSLAARPGGGGAGGGRVGFRVEDGLSLASSRFSLHSSQNQSG